MKHYFEINQKPIVTIKNQDGKTLVKTPDLQKSNTIEDTAVSNLEQTKFSRDQRLQYEEDIKLLGENNCLRKLYETMVVNLRFHGQEIC